MAKKKEEEVVPQNVFEDDEQFDGKAKETHPEAYRAGGSEYFVNLDKLLSMFIIMPRAEKEESFYLPTLMHHGLYEPTDDGTGRRETARACVAAAGIGPCAIDDFRVSLADSRVPGDVKVRDRLEPRKNVKAAVWWIPIRPLLTKASSQFVFSLPTFTGTMQDYEVFDKPVMKVLGLPKGVWENLQILMKSEGWQQFFGHQGKAIYVVGNGKEKLGRRYKEPRGYGQFPDELRPAEDVELVNILEAVKMPTPLEVAQLVDYNWPGFIKDFSLYGEGDVEQPQGAPDTAGGSGGKAPDVFKE